MTLSRLSSVEREVTSTNGERHFLARLLPYRTLDDHIDGVVINFLDITERKRAEQALRQSEERFRLLIEGAKDYAMFLLDSENRITFWSAGAERVFGWSEAEVLGKMGDLIFTVEDRRSDEPEKERRIAMAEGKAEDRRWHLRKDGAVFWADGLLMRLDSPSPGDVRGFAKVTRDATEPKRIEEALRAADEVVRQTNESLEQRVEERTAELARAVEALSEAMAERQKLMRMLVSIQEEERKRISRELHDETGQYLTAFAFALKDLEERLRNEPEISAVELAPSLSRLQKMISELTRDIHRIAVELRPTALDDLGLQPVLQSYIEKWAERVGIAATFECIGFDPSQRFLLPATETAVYRVVQEALTNIAKYALPGGATKATATLHLYKDRLMTVIEDDGPGFDVDATRNAGRLGLAGMRERAELVGGTLEIESKPDKGTTIILYVPTREAQSISVKNAPH